MNTTTTYLGLKLKNPLVAAAGPLAVEVHQIRQLEDAGVSAIVLHSLFEEQLRHESEELDHHLKYGTDTHAESLSYFPQIGEYKLGPEEYLTHIAKAKKAVDVPIIGSLNGATIGGWAEYAGRIESAGADAVELNIYFVAADPKLTSAEVEDRYIRIVKAVKAAVKIPVAVKISPFFSAMASMACRLDGAGADGLVLFNRFYQPDIDLENLDILPKVELSNSFEARLPMRWIAILRSHVRASLAATSGVTSAEDVIKLVMAGADVTQVASVLLRKGIAEAGKILQDIERWMREHEYESIEQMKGSMSQESCPDPTAFERANYMKTLNSYV